MNNSDRESTPESDAIDTAAPTSSVNSGSANAPSSSGSSVVPKRSRRHTSISNSPKPDPPSKKPSSSNQPQSDSSDEEDLIGLEEKEERRAMQPVLIVVTPNATPIPGLKGNIRYVQEFHTEIAPICQEAKLASVHGDTFRSRQYPGVPTKKFNDRHLTQYNDSKKKYNVQAIFEKRDSSGEYFVLCEGWTTSYVETEQYIKTNCLLSLNHSKLLTNFLAALGTIKNAEKARRLRAEGYNQAPGSMFWDFEDMSYFHTMILHETGQNIVHYVSLADSPSRIRPPQYEFTPTIITDPEALKICLENEANKPWSELSAKRVLPAKSPHGGCENPKACICDQKFVLLYGDLEIDNLHVNDNKLLDLTSFKYARARITMECSDQCKCTAKCPRRNLQRGQQKPVVVYYDEEINGYGLKAAAMYHRGEFIGEYVGKLKLINNRDDPSYEVECSSMEDRLVVDSKHMGNYTRFMSHSCDPSAAFVLTYSRRLETDPLIPRIAVYAIKDIGIGQSITISYYQKPEDSKVVDTTGTKCLCKSANCMGFLPKH